MAKDSKSDIDPRFDAAFQRGFDPSIPIEEYVPPRQPHRAATPVRPSLSAPPAAAAPAAEPVPVPAPAPVPVTAATATAPAPMAVAPTTVAETVQSEAAEPDGGAELVETESESESVSESSLARNPFLLFLGIIAVALIAVGVWLFVRTGDAFNSSEVRSQGDYMSLTATINMAPFIALLGAATAIGVLFVFAARWKRRR